MIISRRKLLEPSVSPVESPVWRVARTFQPGAGLILHGCAAALGRVPHCHYPGLWSSLWGKCLWCSQRMAQSKLTILSESNYYIIVIKIGVSEKLPRYMKSWRIFINGYSPHLRPAHWVKILSLDKQNKKEKTNNDQKLVMMQKECFLRPLYPQDGWEARGLRC